MRAELQLFERVEQYLMGNLEHNARLRFETELSSNPNLSAQLEFQQNLLVGIENVALLASTKSAYRKFKVNSLVNKIFLSSVVIAVGITATVAIMNYMGNNIEPTNEEIVMMEEPGSDEGHIYLETAFNSDTTMIAEVVVLEGADAISEKVELKDYVSDQPILNNNEVINNDDTIADFTISVPLNDEDASWLGTPPIAFTPDGDSENDFWWMPSKNMKTFKLRIFERMGKKRTLIFESTDPFCQWDGKKGSLFVQEGKYIYSVKAEGDDGVQYDKGGKIVLERKSEFDKVSWLGKLNIEKNLDGNRTLKVESKNLTTFRFRIYQNKSMEQSDLVYMTFDPNFNWRFKNNEQYWHKNGKYYYIIDGIGLDGKKHITGDVIELQWSKDKKRKDYYDKGLTLTSEIESAVDLNSCNSPSSAVVRVPNLITPNGDGKDDVWSVEVENMKKLNVSIYDGAKIADRRLVYKTNKIGFEWDGRTGRVLNPPGTYYYDLRAEGFDGEVHKHDGKFDMRYAQGKGNYSPKEVNPKGKNRK
ncbi:gliding motility-associated C-terminal domain-containing protein [Crocinitomix catalasitica]|nr:gliding motility-associated C-terminal domain-containing protein [Crocinitomix catalasitica]